MDETPEGPVRTIENYVNGTEIFRDIYTTQHCSQCEVPLLFVTGVSSNYRCKNTFINMMPMDQSRVFKLVTHHSTLRAHVPSHPLFV